MQNSMPDVSDVRGLPPKRALFEILVLLAIIIAVAFGIRRLDSGLSHLFASIVGGSSIGISDSMEPYELKFLTVPRDVTPLEAESQPKKKWLLSIPRAYVTDVIGKNGAIGRDETFIASLELVFDPTKLTFVPLAFAGKSSIPDYAINVSLENTGGYPQIAKVDYCVRVDDFSDFLSKYNVTHRSDKCRNSYPRCLLYSHLDGWDIEIMMSRLLYFSDPQPACRSIKAFLDKYTVQRDVLRVPKSQ